MKYTIDTETKFITLESRECTTEELKSLIEKYPDYMVIADIAKLSQDFELANLLFSGRPRETTVGDLCPCNPSRGGSGICGCTIANNPAMSY